MDFSDIYQLYFKDVFMYVRSLSADIDVAEDVTQETFMKALKMIDNFDGRKDIRAWLFTIAKNTYFSYYKKQKRYSDYEFPENISSDVIPISEHLADEESVMKIHHFLHHMPEPYKEVFNLRVFGELSFEKIGLLFGKSAGWGRVTFYRAKKKIIEFMEEEENGKNQM